MSKSNKSPKSQPSVLPRKEIKSLGELHAIATKIIVVEFNIDGQPFKVEARRLFPNEAAILDDLRQTVLPPIEKGKTIDDDRPRYTDPEFIKKKNLINRVSRALALYWTVPIFKGANPNLQSQDEILKFVEDQMSSDVLDVLYSAVATGGVTLGELVNFSLPSSSQES